MLRERSSQISLAGVARLARVQRPVVSMWRTRSRTTDTPFPDPLDVGGQRELFDVDVIANWIARTGRGNNPDVLDDAAAAALLDQLSEIDVRTRDALAALITLSAVVEERMTSLDAHEIIDLADEVDPDDSAILDGIEHSPSDIVHLAQLAAEIVDSLYSHAAALAEVDGKTFNSGSDVAAETELRAAGTALVNNLAHDVIRSIPHTDVESPVIADVTGTATAFAASFATALPENFSPVVAIAKDVRTEPRRTVRQLLVNGIGRADIATGAMRTDHDRRPVLRAATVNGDAEAGAALAGIADAFADLGHAERAIAYGPASVLVDDGVAPDVDRQRAELIRSGQLRAIVKLPRGLIEARPRQALALWIFAPVAASVALADRWTLVADASEREMDAVTRTTLIDDVVAALGDPTTLRSHAFGIGRPVRSSALAASGGSLVSTRTTVMHAPESIDRTSTREIPARVDEELAALGEFGETVARTLSTSSLQNSLRTADVGTLLSAGHFRYSAGTRVSPREMQQDSGHRVIGPEQVLRGTLDGAQHVDRLAFSRQHPNAALTEPGDVIFVTGSTPAAIVDAEGFSVVAYPARVLRIDSEDSAGLIAPLVAADICRQTSSEWKLWSLRRVVSGQRDALTDTLSTIASERRAVEARLAALDSLSDLVADGVAAGRITLTPTPDPQPKGTR